MEQETKQNKQPRVVAIIGTMAAGKDVLTDYLVQQYQVMAVEIGAFARQLAKEADENGPHLRYDVSVKSLAEQEPEYIIRQLVAEMLETGERPTNTLVITGIRTPAEAAVLKEHFGSDLLLACVRVGDQNVRYERVQARDFATDPDDFHAFAEQDEQMKAENAMAETSALADVTLWNDGSLETYQQQIETYIVPHLFPEK
jgi:dephospho-CoA kinase